MKLSTAINKARRVYVTANIANCGVAIPVSKNIARRSVPEFLALETQDGEYFTDRLDSMVGWYDSENNELYLG